MILGVIDIFVTMAGIIAMPYVVVAGINVIADIHIVAGFIIIVVTDINFVAGLWLGSRLGL